MMLGVVTASLPALRRSLIRTGVGAALVVALQWGLVWIPSVDIPRFERIATELARTDRWRYGYVLQHHGASFQKSEEAMGDDAVGRDGVPGETLPSQMGSE